VATSHFPQSGVATLLHKKVHKKNEENSHILYIYLQTQKLLSKIETLIFLCVIPSVECSLVLWSPHFPQGLGCNLLWLFPNTQKSYSTIFYNFFKEKKNKMWSSFVKIQIFHTSLFSSFSKKSIYFHQSNFSISLQINLVIIH
jgi:hypothetical protein